MRVCWLSFQLPPGTKASTAPPSTSLSRLGQINKAGADDAIFLKQVGGEILTEFNKNNVFKERHFVCQISNGNLP